MDTFLLILGILGVGAVAVAAYVFTVAARNYVSEDQKKSTAESVDDDSLYIVRSPYDRRQEELVVEFPLQLSSGYIVPVNRRLMEDRRVMAA